MVTLRLLDQWGGYEIGAIVEVEPHIGDALLRRRAAERLEVEAPASEAEVETPAQATFRTPKAKKA